MLQKRQRDADATHEQPVKRPHAQPSGRSDGSSAEGGYLSGVRVFLITSTMSTASARMKIWARKVAELGGTISTDPRDASITHAIVGDKPEGVPEAAGRLPSRAQLVQSGWLESSISGGRRLPEAHFLIDAAAVPSPTDAAGEVDLPKVRGYKAWLGPDRWRPEYDAIRTENEIVIRAAYREAADEEVGNGAIVRALVEMEKYWDALDGDFLREQLYVGAAEDGAAAAGRRTEQVVNHRSLSFARAASAVRACAYKIAPHTPPEALAALPFVGAARARQISDLATRSTTAELEQHRADAQVYSSMNEPYEGARGSATRRMFKRLPGVGAATAKLWHGMGFRAYEDVERAMRPGGRLARGGGAAVSAAQAFSVRHRGDLLARCPPADIDEMRAAVLASLSRVAGEGWTIVTVGGAARGLASHDADFVVSHPTTPTEGVVNMLYEDLLSQGKLFPPTEAMCQIQVDRMPTHLERIRAEVVGKDSRMPRHVESMRDEVERHAKASFFMLHNLAADRFDHIFGNFRTEAGCVRRLDVIIAPAEEQHFCVLGWSGSRQYLRFLRQWAVDLGMHLNSHRLMRKDGTRAVIVPDEGPPLNRAGQVAWPPGWGPERRVRSERDIFELLSVEYRPPHERNAP